MTFLSFFLQSPPLRGKTAVYILNQVVPKIKFCPSSSFSILSRNSRLRELHTVQLMPTCSAYSVIPEWCLLFFYPRFTNFRVKLLKWSRHLARSIASYKLLPYYTQHSVTAVSQFSRSSALHFCVSTSLDLSRDIWTPRSKYYWNMRTILEIFGPP